MSRTIKLEILSLLPITYKQCPSCEGFLDQSGIGKQVHNQILGEYPRELLDEQRQLSTLVVELINRFSDVLSIHVIDPQSLPGILKSIKFRVRKYPAFIIDDQELIIGWDRAALDLAIEMRSSDRKM